ncbi:MULTISPECIES: FHA domain-containing protein [Kitasatospora]|uniref:FHA domain-containing protein n=1 Tax=Kitasatospora TaxID=2063 RepID=UPI0031D66978
MPHADPEFLRLARERGWYVVSADQFVDLRRSEPWIEQQPERFLSWSTDVGSKAGHARVRLRPSGIQAVPAHKVSQAIEYKELKHVQRLDPKNREHVRILRSHWRCTARGCDKAMRWPDRLLDWPSVSRSGRAVCDCGALLEELGPRGVTRMFVVSDAMAADLPGGLSAGEFMRFPVSLGDAVQLGRGTLSHGINLGADELRPPLGVKRVSRTHLTVSLEDSSGNPQVYAVDLGSGNGTVLLRGGSTVERRLEPGERVAFGEKDRLVLGGTVTLRISGQRHFTGEQASLPELGGSGGGSTLLS